MVLPSHILFPVLQPNLGFQDTQEDIIFDLTSTAWALHKNNQKFIQHSNVLEREEECAKILRGVPKVQEQAVVNRLSQASAIP